MRKIFFIILSIFILTQITFAEHTYPFIYIPGMFDNGDLLTKDSLLVTSLNNKSGFYYNNYFKNNNTYEEYELSSSSNIVDSKYNRLSVANLTGSYRTDISLYLMAKRFFCLMHGEAPKFSNYKFLTNYNGMDFNGYIIKNDHKIYYKGLIEEVWSKYGKEVFYINKNGKYKIITNTNDYKHYRLHSYQNNNGYFDEISQIKFNVIAHSSGGVALRKYLEYCKKEKLTHHINTVINLSVPQKGARLIYSLKDAFPELISDTMDSFFKNKDSKSVSIINNGKKINFTYNELINKTKAEMIYGESENAKKFRKLIGNYILYSIPFDGKSNVLGRDPSLWDLNPNHKLIKELNISSIPDDINIYNLRVTSPFAPFFKKLSMYLNLEQSDGVVDFRDSCIDFFPNSDQLNYKDIIVEKANHIPFPYIKAIFELRETIKTNYPFLKILLKNNYEKEYGITLIHALMKAIMQEMDFDLEDFLEHQNYSVIDYFAENPFNIN